MLKRLFGKQETIVNKEVVKENIPHENFLKGQADGMIERESIFSVNGIQFYAFKNGMRSIAAKRWLMVQSELTNWKENGMSLLVQKEYATELLEEVRKIKSDPNDVYAVLDATDRIQQIGLILDDSLNNFSLIGVMLEICSMCIIYPSEDPFDIDMDECSNKIAIWNAALQSDKAKDFMGFFCKLFLTIDKSWMDLLKESIAYMDMELTENQMKEANLQRNLLILELDTLKKRLNGLKPVSDSTRVALRLQSMLNLVKLRWNGREYSSISGFKI